MFLKKWLRAAPRGFIVLAISLIVIDVVTVLAAFYLGLHQEQGQYFDTWLKAHLNAFLLWRLSLLTLIFLLWPLMIRYRLKGKQVSAKTLKKLIDQRYVVILALIIIDIILHLF